MSSPPPSSFFCIIRGYPFWGLLFNVNHLHWLYALGIHGVALVFHLCKVDGSEVDASDGAIEGGLVIESAVSKVGHGGPLGGTWQVGSLP